MKITIQAPKKIQVLSREQLRRVQRDTAQDARDAIQQWYNRLPEDYFDSDDANFPDGTPKHGQARTFMRALTQNWEWREITDSGFSLIFNTRREDGSPWGLRLHEYGGTIKPKKARALTIPLTAEARGRRAREFSGLGRHLFKVGGSQATGDKLGTLVWEDAAGQLHAAYALRKSAKIEPLYKRRGHHAIPQPQELSQLISPYFSRHINYILKKK